MKRRGFLAASLLTPLGAMGATGEAHAAGQRFTFAANGSAFLLDGKPFQIRSGEMHPVRIPRQYWRHRVQMAKAMGLNTIGVYLMWNYLEERQGRFDLTTDRRDFAAFIRICQEEGMWVLLRPGPYVCAEWDLGGLPAWLLADDPVALRTSKDAQYMAAVRRYVKAIAPVAKPLMIDNGGPVLMVQVENEFGSYGNETAHLTDIRQMWLDDGITGPFYTQDGLRQVEENRTVVPGGAIGLSGGTAADIARCRASFPAVPAMSGELYPGWLTHWGEPAMAGPTDITGTLRGLMDGNLSFNIYVLHGGTNFGYWAGANFDDKGYQPDVTSYDYGAPITEQGAPAALYPAYRDLIAGYVGTPPPIPAAIPTIAHDGVTPTPYASLWDNLPAKLDTRTVKPMEAYGQNSGFMLYRKAVSSGGTLKVTAVHDYATVFANGTYQGGISRTALPSSYAGPLQVTTGDSLALPNAVATVDILVEGLGRINFGHEIVDRKGITQQVSLAGTTLTGWQTYPLPVDEAYVAALKPVISAPDRPGIFFKATLTLSTVGDTYLDMTGWTHGLVWVNGNNLGRYWKIGPQQNLFCPGTWLRKGANEVMVLDLHQLEPKPISLRHKLSNYSVLVNRRSGKALDVPGLSATPGTQLIQYTQHGNANQQWLFNDLGNGVSTIASAVTGLVVDVADHSTADGAKIIQWTANGGVNQQWRLVDAGGGYVKIVSARSGKLLGVGGDPTADKAPIAQQSDTGSTSQHWQVIPA
ncbi:beta-galactosidase [Kibdelosporangium phytohabitans]|uniref:beta-galactosidase n=1 Tax=Kibdelosporangium phytohabitans TaxID=860235 RepID=UPI0007C64F7F|nr:beta-galactosidase [Kibdelosporangium phytohabitans]MBE1469643.1 beta-galactosidase [Kibdelosporangium phytohabitans]